MASETLIPAHHVVPLLLPSNDEGGLKASEVAKTSEAFAYLLIHLARNRILGCGGIFPYTSQNSEFYCQICVCLSPFAVPSSRPGSVLGRQVRAEAFLIGETFPWNIDILFHQRFYEAGYSNLYLFDRHIFGQFPIVIRDLHT